MIKSTQIVCLSEDSDEPGHPPSLTKALALSSDGNQGPKLF